MCVLFADQEEIVPFCVVVASLRVEDPVPPPYAVLRVKELQQR